MLQEPLPASIDTIINGLNVIVSAIIAILTYASLRCMRRDK